MANSETKVVLPIIWILNTEISYSKQIFHSKCVIWQIGRWKWWIAVLRNLFRLFIRCRKFSRENHTNVNVWIEQQTGKIRNKWKWKEEINGDRWLHDWFSSRDDEINDKVWMYMKKVHEKASNPNRSIMKFANLLDIYNLYLNRWCICIVIRTELWERESKRERDEREENFSFFFVYCVSFIFRLNECIHNQHISTMLQTDSKRKKKQIDNYRRTTWCPFLGFYFARARCCNLLFVCYGRRLLFFFLLSTR